MKELPGYECRIDRNGGHIYIRRKTGQIFFGYTEALQDLFWEMCLYASTRPSDDPIHRILS